MHVDQIYTGCLAQGAYYIESQGEVAIIDPLRETSPYTQKAKDQGHKIKYVFETHFHADFVSGHLDLAKETGAEIVYGPGANTEYKIHQATDGEVFRLGDVKIEVLHTPGHTPESSCYLLYDETGKEHAIFSGDTLFIGDVGRPDLAIKSDLTRDDLARMLYKSLRTKIMPLPDDVIVYPAHGAGSACGKNMSNETSDLLGNQKKTNYALRGDMKEEEFVAEVTEGLLPPPQYFAKNAALNKDGYESINTVMNRGVVPMSVEDFEFAVNEGGALVIDTRLKDDFRQGFIPNSIFIGLDGSFAAWVGTLIPDLRQPIVFVADKGKEEEVVLRLARVGYDNALGYLEGGFSTWVAAGKEIDVMETVNGPELAQLFKENPKNINILDVRKPAEYNSEHLRTAVNTPLDFINDYMGQLNRDNVYYLHCKSGYRSMIMSSILKSRGYAGVVDVDGGFDAILQTDLPRSA